jgi:hypothetical protein
MKKFLLLKLIPFTFIIVIIACTNCAAPTKPGSTRIRFDDSTAARCDTIISNMYTELTVSLKTDGFNAYKIIAVLGSHTFESNMGESTITILAHENDTMYKTINLMLKVNNILVDHTIKPVLILNDFFPENNVYNFKFLLDCGYTSCLSQSGIAANWVLLGIDSINLSYKDLSITGRMKRNCSIDYFCNFLNDMPDLNAQLLAQNNYDSIVSINPSNPNQYYFCHSFRRDIAQGDTFPYIGITSGYSYKKTILNGNPEEYSFHIFERTKGWYEFSDYSATFNRHRGITDVLIVNTSGKYTHNVDSLIFWKQ